MLDDRARVPAGLDRNHKPRGASEAIEEAATLYRRFVESRGHKRPPPHELDPRAAGGAFQASVRGMFTATRSRYVIDKFTKSGIPILVTVLVVFLLGRVLLIPMNLFALVLSAVPGVRREGVLELGKGALTDVLSSVALLLMLLLRSFLHKPIFKCFIHTLRDLNPGLAQQVETTPIICKMGPESVKPSDQQQQRRPLRYKVARMAFLMLVSKAGRRIPVLNWFVAPVMLFFSGERLLGTQNALVLAAVGLVPPIAPWALDFLHLWRASHVTGSELLSDYTDHVISPDARGAWFRRNEVAVFCFTAPQLLLMQMPVVGPLLFLPASAAAAFLADYLHRLPYNAAFQVSPLIAGSEIPLSSSDRTR